MASQLLIVGKETWSTKWSYVIKSTLLQLLLLYTCVLIKKPASGSVTPPQNTAVVMGQSFSMQCRMPPQGGIVNINWWNPWNVIVATNGEADLRYYVTYVAQNGSSKLTSVTTAASYAGMYCCIIALSGQQVQLCAELILPSSAGLQCIETREAFVEGETIGHICEVTYAGRWAPRLQWSSSIGLEEVDSITETDETAARYRLNMVAHRRLQGSTFTCRGRFDQPREQLPSNHASNTPSFTFTPCQTNKTVIYWPPSNSCFEFLPKKAMYRENETVVCLCDTNPKPLSIRWLTSEGTIISDIKMLRIPPPGEYTYACEVTNDVGSEGVHDVRVETKNLQFSVGSANENGTLRAYHSNGNDTRGLFMVFICFLGNIILDFVTVF